MDHHVVRGEHLVDGGHRHGLGPAGGPGGIETGRLVEGAVFEVGLEGRRGLPGGIFFIGDGFLGAGAVDDHQPGGAVGGERQGLEDAVAEFRAVHQHGGTGIVDAVGELARGDPEIHRAADGAVLLGGDVGESELGAVAQHQHHHASVAGTVRMQCVGKLVASLVELAVGPTPLRVRVDHRRLVGKTAHIAHVAFQPGVITLENVFECSHNPVRFDCKSTGPARGGQRVGSGGPEK